MPCISIIDTDLAISFSENLQKYLEAFLDVILSKLTLKTMDNDISGIQQKKIVFYREEILKNGS